MIGRRVNGRCQVNLFVNQLVTIGAQQIQFGAGPRYFAVGPSGAQRWGFRLNFTLVYPLKSPP
jgi:hypothetical protein